MHECKNQEKKDIGKVVRIVMGCVILHNMLLPEPRVEQDYYDKHASDLLDDPDFANEVERVIRSEEIRRWILNTLGKPLTPTSALLYPGGVSVYEFNRWMQKTTRENLSLPSDAIENKPLETSSIRPIQALVTTKRQWTFIEVRLWNQQSYSIMGTPCQVVWT